MQSLNIVQSTGKNDNTGQEHQVLLWTA